MLRGNRFRLVTLGRLTLLGVAGEEDASLAKRRFKLALLAVLAMARRPLSRAALLEMFWGDQDEARARHSLSNALSSLRRSLGASAITTRDAEVALASDLGLDVDALELGEAVEGRDFARAIELYEGPFLEGVHVEDSPAFEQWVSRERRRLEALFVQACQQQCVMLARTRRWPECHEVAARWLDAEPLSADAAIFLLNAVKAPGTRAALVQALEEYERLRVKLAREFELVPERGVAELAERTREQLGALPPEPVVIATPEPAAPIVTRPATQADVAAAVSASPPLAAEPEPTAPPAVVERRAPPERRGHPLLWSGIGAAVVVGLLALWYGVRAVERGTAAPGGGGKPVIAVLTMTVSSSDSALAWLAEGLPQMIAGKLARATAIDVVPAEQVRAVVARSGRGVEDPLDDATARDLARRVGATLVARGAISRDGGSIVLDLNVREVGGGDFAHNDVLSRDDALALADEAAVRILSAANVTAPGPQLSELETSSLEAYQHYMRALEVGQLGRLSEAKRELDAAIALDSGFIPVLRQRMGNAIGDNDTALTRRLRETMRRFEYRATEFDRLHQEATDAYLNGEHELSEARARALVRRYPRDPRGYYLLWDILGAHGKFVEAGRVAEEGIALDSMAINAGPGPCVPCIGLYTIVGLSWVRGDFAGAAEWARRWIRAQPEAAAAWGALAWTYSYLQRPDSALPLMARAVSLSGGDLYANGEYIRMLLVARRYDAADSAITALAAVPSPERREAAADLRAVLERERGRVRESMRVIDRMVVESPEAAGFAEIVRADNQRLLGDYRGAARRFEAPAHGGGIPFTLPVPAGAARAYCWHHALAADALAPTGDTVTLRAMADTLERGCTRSFYGRDWRLFHHVRGLIAMQGRRYAEAEQEFRQAVWAPAEGWTRTTVELAEAQAASGRPLDAVRTLRTGYATRLDAMGRYVPISELDYRMARTFAQAGQRDSARVYAAYVRSAWRDADPEIRRLLERLP